MEVGAEQVKKGMVLSSAGAQAEGLPMFREEESITGWEVLHDLSRECRDWGPVVRIQWRK